jgi:hypothetical protein
MKPSSAFILASIFGILTSCIGIDANAKIAANGAVDVSIRYTVSSAVDELGRLGANAKYLPLPVGRDDLELAANRAGGELRSWSRKDDSDKFTVSSTLRFPDTRSFVQFLDPAGELASLVESNGTSTLSMTLSGGINPADPNLAGFLELAFGDYLVAITLELPKTPSAVGGFSVKGNAVSFSMKAVDLYSSPKPVKVTASW